MDIQCAHRKRTTFLLQCLAYADDVLVTHDSCESCRTHVALMSYSCHTDVTLMSHSCHTHVTLMSYSCHTHVVLVLSHVILM